MQETKLTPWKIRPVARKNLLSGHPWIQKRDLERAPQAVEIGAAVEIVDQKDQFLAWGFANPKSPIAIRVLDFRRLKSSPDHFVRLQLVKALQRRQSLGLTHASHRLCFAEGDGLSGLIIDRYLLDGGKQVLAVQVMTPGFEQVFAHAGEFFSSLFKMGEFGNFEDTAIIIRRNSGARHMEGLKNSEAEVVKDIEGVDLNSAPILLRGRGNQTVTVHCDLIEGQKTGFFLDQSENVRGLLNLISDSNIEVKKCMDLFSYVGQWGSQIAKLKSDDGIEVLTVDCSQSALNFSDQNVKLNGGESRTLKLDITGKAKQLPSEEFDVVICDPPALIKNKRDFHKGKHAYVKVNTEALRRVRSGGIFVSCSCSQNLSEKDLKEVVQQAQFHSGKTVSWIQKGQQAFDHPIRSEFPEGFYLKSLVGLVE